jgi:hypothetical protein
MRSRVPPRRDEYPRQGRSRPHSAYFLAPEYGTLLGMPPLLASAYRRAASRSPGPGRESGHTSARLHTRCCREAGTLRVTLSSASFTGVELARHGDRLEGACDRPVSATFSTDARTLSPANARSWWVPGAFSQVSEVSGPRGGRAEVLDSRPAGSGAAHHGHRAGSAAPAGRVGAGSLATRVEHRLGRLPVTVPFSERKGEVSDRPATATACRDCGRRIPAGNTRCSRCGAAFVASHGHNRSQLAEVVAAGLGVCARCGESVLPGQDWDARRTRHAWRPRHRACGRDEQR